MLQNFEAVLNLKPAPGYLSSHIRVKTSPKIIDKCNNFTLILLNIQFHKIYK